jgi:hypothetical protein
LGKLANGLATAAVHLKQQHGFDLHLSHMESPNSPIKMRQIEQRLAP